MNSQKFKNKLLERQHSAFLNARKVIVKENELRKGDLGYSVRSTNQLLLVEIRENVFTYRYYTKEARCRDRTTLIRLLGGTYHGPITFER